MTPTTKRTLKNSRAMTYDLIRLFYSAGRFTSPLRYLRKYNLSRDLIIFLKDTERIRMIRRNRYEWIGAEPDRDIIEELINWRRQYNTKTKQRKCRRHLDNSYSLFPLPDQSATMPDRLTPEDLQKRQYRIIGLLGKYWIEKKYYRKYLFGLITVPRYHKLDYKGDPTGDPKVYQYIEHAERAISLFCSRSN